MVLDNLSNSSEKSLERVEKITGKKVPFYKADILDREALNQIAEDEKIMFFTPCLRITSTKVRVPAILFS